LKAERFIAAARVREARKAYGAVQALRGLSFAVDPGEWIALLGPNGAGKTTLMLALAGLVRLDGGKVELFGQPVRGPAARVGFVPQEIAIYPLLSVRENLRVFGRLNGIAGAALSEHVEWAVRWTGLEARADCRAGTLSGGMQRRLNIACGVLHRPRLVLLDEPAVGVDPQGRQRIWDMLDELRASGASLIQSTHELNEIETVCDRMLIIDRGRLIADGTVDDLVRRHLGTAASFALTLAEPPTGLELPGDIAIRGATVEGRLPDVAVDLPRILERLRTAGASIRHVRVDTPGLEAVFTRLTGRELRE